MQMTPDWLRVTRPSTVGAISVLFHRFQRLGLGKKKGFNRRVVAPHTLTLYLSVLTDISQRSIRPIKDARLLSVFSLTFTFYLTDLWHVPVMDKYCCSSGQMIRYSQGKAQLLTQCQMNTMLVGQGKWLEEFAALLQPPGAQSPELQQVDLAPSFSELLDPPCLLCNARQYQ